MANVPPFVTSITQTLRRNGVVFVVIAVFAAAVVWKVIGHQSGTSSQPPATTPIVSAQPFRRAIDGVIIDGAEPPTTYFAITIDNQVAARPASGIGQAPLVMEVPVEGGITRFMAIFPYTGTVAKIGPVRSVRPYFIDWASEFDATFTHVGGSPEAIARLAKTPTRNQDEFAWGKFFWRDTVRQAPHNVYTSILLMNNAKDLVRGTGPSTQLSSWLFKDDAALTDRPATTPNININYSDPAYAVSWAYDRDQNNYRRTRGTKSETDSDGRVITAKNIVVLSTTVDTVDTIGRRKIQTIGAGQATVYRDGLSFSVQWKKPSIEERLRFFTADGQELKFNAGTTWIEVVPK